MMARRGQRFNTAGMTVHLYKSVLISDLFNRVVGCTLDVNIGQIIRNKNAQKVTVLWFYGEMTEARGETIRN